MSPNGRKFLSIYSDQLLKNANIHVREQYPQGVVLLRVLLKKLRHSTIVLADLTDQNPNVFYELGVRHSLSKRTILVAQGIKHIPSDLRGEWYIEYGVKPAEVSGFKAEIKRLISEIEDKPHRNDSPILNGDEDSDVYNLRIKEYPGEILSFHDVKRGARILSKMVSRSRWYPDIIMGVNHGGMTVAAVISKAFF